MTLFARVALVALALTTTLAGCKERSLEVLPAEVDGGDRNPQNRPDGRAPTEAGPPGDGSVPTDGPVEAGPRPEGGVCVPSRELCNGVDDDCDGVIDESFEFNTDPANCGRCGRVCEYGNAAAACAAGRCTMGACQAGFVDLDRLDVNGCECQLSNGGVEICDGLDNDCDGATDEGFDLDNEVANCGECGRVCAFTNAAASCNKGKCQQGACNAGFVDLDGQPQNGCEYACAPSNAGAEICDGKDNDCDGAIDDEDARIGTQCWPQGIVGCDVGMGTCKGGCALGTWQCLPGGLVCQGAVLPKTETCNGFDDDCDGSADEDYDLLNDPRWCGACNAPCSVPNAVPGCTQGTCVVRNCRPGFVDLDGGPGNGCEYECTRDGPEVCDGRDNDCDGATDVADADLLYPPANFCLQVGECGKGPGGSPRYPEATFPVCTRATTGAAHDWICNYPASVQLFAANQVLGQETWCDGLDNDCDGATDEHPVPAVGSACTDNGVGECRKTGVLRCQADRTLAPACDVSAAPNTAALDERCDGKDNDCDGLTDESWDDPASRGGTCAGAACLGVRDDVVHVTTGGNDYWIYAVEASRADATATAQGVAEQRACARGPANATGPVQPWTNVTLAQARAACAAAGMRLCTTARTTACSSASIVRDEWGFACRAGLTCGATDRTFPYGCSYAQATCNGVDAGLGAAAASGSLAQCATEDLDAVTPGTQSAWDLSGNVAEWTEDCRGTLDDGTNRKVYTLRGGSFSNLDVGLRCGFFSLAVAETFAFPDTGFRCCSSCAPGLADCAGACVDLGTSAGHCGACGNACAAGQQCDNGRCR